VEHELDGANEVVLVEGGFGVEVVDIVEVSPELLFLLEVVLHRKLLDELGVQIVHYHLRPPQLMPHLPIYSVKYFKNNLPLLLVQNAHSICSGKSI